MSKDFVEKFHSVSIRGRYIYGYLCLMKVIQIKKVHPLPHELDNILCEFVSSDKLDKWQDFANELLPSVIMDKKNNRSSFEYISYELGSSIREYYKLQPLIIKKLIEEIIYLGMSNLFGAFNSNVSFPYIKKIVSILQSEDIILPNFSAIENCSVKESFGWGDNTTMNIFINTNN